MRESEKLDEIQSNNLLLDDDEINSLKEICKNKLIPKLQNLAENAPEEAKGLIPKIPTKNPNSFNLECNRANISDKILTAKLTALNQFFCGYVDITSKKSVFNEFRGDGDECDLKIKAVQRFLSRYICKHFGYDYISPNDGGLKPFGSSISINDTEILILEAAGDSFFDNIQTKLGNEIRDAPIHEALTKNPNDFKQQCAKLTHLEDESKQLLFRVNNTCCGYPDVTKAYPFNSLFDDKVHDHVELENCDSKVNTAQSILSEYILSQFQERSTSNSR